MTLDRELFEDTDMVGSKLRRPLEEKQRKRELQLQPEFQHDNACSSSPPPSQQSGGDEYLSDLGTPQTVVKKENAQRQQDRRGSTSQAKDLPSPVRSAADACSWREWSSADFAKGQEGKNNGWREWSSAGDFAKGQGKPKLRSIRSTSPEDNVHELLVDPLNLFTGIVSEIKAAKQLKKLSTKHKKQTHDQKVDDGVQFNLSSKALQSRGKGLADQTRVELQEKGWNDRSIDILGKVLHPETVLNLTRNFRHAAVCAEAHTENLSPTVKSPTVKNVYTGHGMTEDGSERAGFWTFEQFLSDADNATQTKLIQALDQIPHDEGQNFFDKYNSPPKTGESPNLQVDTGRVRQLGRRNSTAPLPRLWSQTSSNEVQHSQVLQSIRRASTHSHMMNRRASIFNQPSSALPINVPCFASTSSGSQLPQSTGITFIPPITQRRPRPWQKDL